MKPILHEVFMPLTNGLRLYNKILLPEESGKFPIVLIRTPYDRDPTKFPVDADAEIHGQEAFLSHGYAVVIQHCRGTGGSDGDFLPYQDERADGFECLDWLRTLPFYMGEIYLYGGSYLSTVHLCILDKLPDDVKGACLEVQDCRQYNISYLNGFFKHGLHMSWVIHQFKKKTYDSTVPAFDFPDCIRKRPISGLFGRLFGEGFPAHDIALEHPDPDDPFWVESPYVNTQYHAMEKCRIPLLLIGGYYDIYALGMREMWTQLPPEIRSRCAIVYGPWSHGRAVPNTDIAMPNAKSGERKWGVEWFEHLRHGSETPLVQEGKVTYYRIGEGWKQSDLFPTGTDSLTLYPQKNGTLADSPSNGSFTYRYNPEDPASFPGGSHSLGSNGGLMEQPCPNFRPDVLSFLSAPLEESFTMEGCPEITLDVSSDCDDTAVYARLDIVRNGHAWVIDDCIDSLRRGKGDYTPGERRKVTLKLDFSSWKFEPGDRIRMDVSSSNFPTFNAHTNTSELWCDAVQTVPAHNTVWLEGCKVDLPCAKK